MALQTFAAALRRWIVEPETVKETPVAVLDEAAIAAHHFGEGQVDFEVDAGHCGR